MIFNLLELYISKNIKLIYKLYISAKIIIILFFLITLIFKGKNKQIEIIEEIQDNINSSDYN